MDSTTGTKSKSETFRQRLLRGMYPLIRKMAKKGKNGTILENENDTTPASSFYALKADLNDGTTLQFSDLKGIKVLLVNTASDCGYTGQYAELQELHEKYGDKVYIIGFPANDFGQQEKKGDSEIAQFCQINYGVTFPVALKGVVLKKEDQQPIFTWLTDKNMNGWNEHAPDWNFSKYIINEQGILTHYFGPSISPLEDTFTRVLA